MVNIWPKLSIANFSKKKREKNDDLLNIFKIFKFLILNLNDPKALLFVNSGKEGNNKKNTQLTLIM